MQANDYYIHMKKKVRFLKIAMNIENANSYGRNLTLANKSNFGIE